MNYLPNMTKLLFLCCLTGLLLAASCKTDDEMNPLSAMDDHIIVQCKIDGKDWTAAGEGDFFGGQYPFLDLQYYSDTGSLGLTASRSIEAEPVEQTINIDCFFHELNVKNPLRTIGGEFKDLSLIHI